MYRKILIATDGSELADGALSRGLQIARVTGASIVVVTVSDFFPTASGSLFPKPEDLERYESSAAGIARGVLDKAADAARRLDISCKTRHVADKPPAEGILEVSQSEGCDLIVMGTHGRRGLDRLLLGSQADKVVTASPISVLVVR